MLDRGLRARASTTRSSARRARRDGGSDAGAARPARAADVHDRPGQRTRLRRRDLGRARRRRRDPRVGAHRRRLRVRRARLARRPRGAAAGDERVRPGRGRADAAGGALEREVLAACRGRTGSPSRVELELDGARVVRAAFMRSLIRSDERLDYDRVDRIFAGARAGRSEPWAAPLEARARPRRGRSARSGRGAEGSRSPAPSPSSRSTARGHVRSVRVAEQTESHRLIEHLMIAANEQVATAAGASAASRRSTASTRSPIRSASSASSRSSRRSRCRRRRCREHLTPSEAGELVGRDLAGASSATCARAAAAGGRSAR